MLAFGWQPARHRDRRPADEPLSRARSLKQSRNLPGSPSSQLPAGLMRAENKAMFVRLRVPAVVLLLFVSIPAALSGQIPSSVYEQVSNALEQGKFGEAEQLLRPALQEHPDARTLGLMGVILDAQKRYDEAEAFISRRSNWNQTPLPC